MNSKLALLIVMLGLGAMFMWYAAPDLIALQSKIETRDYQAYTKEVGK